jgi:hypothetical protein
MSLDSDDLVAQISRRASDTGQETMFDIEPVWTDYWQGLPEFNAVELKPTRELTLQFLTNEDYLDFIREASLNPRSHHKRVWWPEPYRPDRAEVQWIGTPSLTRYPIFIPSKGRAGIATTPRLLDQAGAQYFLVVEDHEVDEYKSIYGSDKVLSLGFSNLGQGSIPARNWIWERAVETGATWHWVIDDNIQGLYRAHGNKRLMVRKSSAPLRMVEDFVDRYENLAFAGLNSRAFMPDTSTTPLRLNTRIYSMTLINTALPYRWRGRYNEDTDLCLRALKDGWSTALFCNMLMDKPETARGDGTKGMRGGNTDNVYVDGDHRRAFAESLKEQHPDVVDIVWKFNRWHHQVDYSSFKKNKLVRKSHAVFAEDPEYGLTLVRGHNDSSEKNTGVGE